MTGPLPCSRMPLSKDLLIPHHSVNERSRLDSCSTVLLPVSYRAVHISRDYSPVVQPFSKLPLPFAQKMGTNGSDNPSKLKVVIL
jgi:hypothetical protein